MNEVFHDIPEALSNTVEILDKVEFYNIDHDEVVPPFPIPKECGSKEEYAQSFKNWYFNKYVAGTRTHRQLLNQQQALQLHSLFSLKHLPLSKVQAPLLLVPKPFPPLCLHT